MIHEIFNDQIDRLKDVYGARNYSNERIKVLWHSYGREPDSVFVLAIDIVIASERSCPLHPQIDKALSQARGMVNSVKYPIIPGANIYEQLQEISKIENDELKKEFVGECLEIIKSKLDRALSPKQFQESCDLLDEVASNIKKQRKGSMNAN